MALLAKLSSDIHQHNVEFCDQLALAPCDLGSLGSRVDTIDGPLSIIIEFLDLKSLMSLLSSSKDNQVLLSKNRLWQNLLIRDFGLPSVPANLGLCKTVYKTNCFAVQQLLSKNLDVAIDAPAEAIAPPRFTIFHLFAAFQQAEGFRDHNPFIPVQKYMIFSLRLMTFLEDPANRSAAEENAIFLKDKSIKSGFLNIIAKSYIMDNDFPEAIRVLQKAQEVAMQITLPMEKYRRLFDIAKSYLQANNPAAAEEVAMLIPFPYELKIVAPFNKIAVFKLIKKYYEKNHEMDKAERINQQIPLFFRDEEKTIIRELQLY